MTQHIKTKHYDKIGEYKRGRGRPKKAEGIDSSLAQAREVFFKNFFLKPSRGCYEIDNSKSNKELTDNTDKNDDSIIDDKNKHENKTKLLDNTSDSNKKKDENGININEEYDIKNQTFNEKKLSNESIHYNLELAAKTLLNNYSNIISLEDKPKEINNNNNNNNNNNSVDNTIQKTNNEAIENNKDSEEYDIENVINILKKNNNLFSIKIDDNFSQQKLKTMDECFMAYLDYSIKLANTEYYQFICKFVLLFREFINTFKKGNNNTTANSNLVPFTINNTSDCVPEYCNDFMIDYIEANDNFGLDFDELIDLVQHYCCWLYENGLTMSIISLISV